MGIRAHSIAILIVAVGGAFAGASPGFAQGDGSRTDNPDLLRGSLGMGCPAGTLCDFPPAHLAAAPIALPTQPALAPAPAMSVETATVPAMEPAISTVSTPPAPAPTPNAREFEYGISLRGAYVRSGSDERFEMLAIPDVSVSRSTGATDFSLDASASLIQPQSSDPRVGSASVSAGTVHRLSPSAGLAFNTDLALVQDDAAGLTVDEMDLATAPVTVAGSVGAAYTQRFGRLNATGTLGFSREWVGASTRIDGTEIDNSGDSFTRYAGGLRVGYELTPVLEIFGQGDLGRTVFDAADRDLGVSRTGNDFALRAGVATNWNDVVTLEASLGSGWRAYEAGSLADAQSWLYGAAIGYRPTATTQLRASLETQLSPGEREAGASTNYLAGVELTHAANSWLELRAAAGMEWLAPKDGTLASRLYTAGAGADLILGAHTSATLDYEYGLREDPGAASTSRDEHRVSGGISLRY